MNSKIKNLLAILFIVLFSSTLYVLTLRGQYGNPNPETMREELAKDFKSMELSPERGRFAHVISLAENGTYELSSALVDFVYPDVGFIKDKYYSYFAPGISHIAVPFYNFGKQFNLAQVFSFALISLFSIGAMIFIYLIARQIFELPVWASILAPIFYAFSSSAWSYAITFYQHHLTVFFFVAGFYSAWQFGRNKKWSWVWGFIPWISYASAFTVDYPNPLFLLPMMIYFFWQAWNVRLTDDVWRISFRTSFIFVSIGFFVITAWHLNLNATHFGGWQKLAGGLTSYKKLEVRPILDTSITATTTTFYTTTTVATAEAPEPGITTVNTATSTTITTISIATTTSNTTTFVIATEIRVIGLKKEKPKDIVGFFVERRLPYSGYILFASPERGLLIFWPLCIIGFIGLYSAFKHKPVEVSTLFGGVFINMFLYFSWGDPWGGWAFGPRYMILSISILSIFVAYWVAKGELWKRIVVFELFLYSSFISLAGALTTNAVPPKVEAIPLGAEYTYFRNIDFLFEGKSGSFFYNSYAIQNMSLLEYAFLIYICLVLVVALLIFVFPKFKNDN